MPIKLIYDKITKQQKINNQSMSSAPNPRQGPPENAPPPIAPRETQPPRDQRTERAAERGALSETVISGNDDTAKKIDAIKLSEKIDAQKQEFAAFSSVLLGLPQVLTRLGVPLDTIAHLDSKALDPAVFAKLNKAEQAAVRKISEMRTNQNSEITRRFLVSWPEYVRNVSAQRAIVEGKPTAPEHTGMIAAFTEKAKKDPYGTAILVMLGAAGLYGAYRLIKKVAGDSEKTDAKPDDKKDESGDGPLDTAWKWAKRALIGAGLLFGIGRLIGLEGVQKFLREHGIDVADNRITAALIHFSKFEWKKGWQVLTEGTKEYHSSKAIAEKISTDMGKTVSPETLAALAKTPYKEFMGVGGKAKSFIDEKMVALRKAALGDKGNTAYEKISDARTAEMIAEEGVIRAYFEKHKTEIEKTHPTDRTTVIEVAANLTGETQTLEAARQAQNPEYKKASEEFDPVIAKMPPGKKRDLLQAMKQDVFPLLVSDEEVQNLITELKKRNIDTTKLETAAQKVKVARAKLLQQSQDPNVTDEDFQKTAMELAEGIDEVKEVIEALEGELQYRPDWQQTKYLFATQGIMRLREYYRKPKFVQNWIKDKLVQTVTYPIRKGIEIVKNLNGQALKEEIAAAEKEVSEIGKRWTNGGLKPEEVEAIKSGKSELTKEQIDRLIASGKCKDAQKALDDVVTMRASEAKRQLLSAKDVLTTKKSELAALKKEKVVDARKVASLEEEIKVRTSGIKDLELEFSRKHIRFLDRELDGFNRELGELIKEGKPVSHIEWERYAAYEKEILARRSHIEGTIMERIEDLKKLKAGKAIGKNEVQLRAEIQALYNDMTIDGKTLAHHTLSKMGKLSEWWKRVRGNPQTYGQFEKLYKDELQRSRAMLGHLTSHTEGMGIKATLSRMKPTKGKLAIYGIMIGIGGALGSDEKTDFGTAAAQAALDITPFGGTYSDWYSVVTGEERITKRKLDFNDRLLRAAFGTAGALCDIGTVFGIGLAGRGILGGVRGIKAGAAIAKTAKAVEAVKATETVARAAKVGKEAHVVETGVRTAEEVAHAGKGLATGERATVEASTALARDAKVTDITADVAGKGASGKMERIGQRFSSVGGKMQLAAGAATLGYMGYSILLREETVDIPPEAQAAMDDMNKMLPPETADAPATSGQAPPPAPTAAAA